MPERRYCRAAIDGGAFEPLSVKRYRQFGVLANRVLTKLADIIKDNGQKCFRDNHVGKLSDGLCWAREILGRFESFSVSEWACCAAGVDNGAHLSLQM
jgi:hypothetical protein